MAYTPASAGEFRHVIRIQEQIASRDNFGSNVIAWVDKFTKVYASCEPLSGRELMNQGNVENEVTTRFKIRYREGVLPQQRIVYRNKFYDIKSVIPDNESGLEWLTILCTEGLNDGA